MLCIVVDMTSYTPWQWDKPGLQLEFKGYLLNVPLDIPKSALQEAGTVGGFLF